MLRAKRTKNMSLIEVEVVEQFVNENLSKKFDKIIQMTKSNGDYYVKGWGPSREVCEKVEWSQVSKDILALQAKVQRAGF